MRHVFLCRALVVTLVAVVANLTAVPTAFMATAASTVGVPSPVTTYDASTEVYDGILQGTAASSASASRQQFRLDPRAAAAPADPDAVTTVGVAAKTESGAVSALSGVRLRAQLTGEQIAGGHAFDAHVVKAGEFPGITTRSEFAARIESVVTNGESRELLRGRTAYWQGDTVVIRDPASLDGGTAFVPTGGYNYFLGLK